MTNFPDAQPPFRRLLWILSSLVIILIQVQTASGQPAANKSDPYSAEDLAGFVRTFKTDPRGPFQGIRWFCPDGAILGPQERCTTSGGIQHALPKDVIVQIQQRNGIYLGQILAGTDFTKFLDAPNRHARLKQYIIERYLAAVDDGWIFRRAQYYRGAYQAEDEERWGNDFLTWLLRDANLTKSHYFLLREAVRSIPHASSNNALLTIRALSKELADGYAPFMDLRVKIHGQPEATDTTNVKSFIATHNSRLTTPQRQRFEQLIREMRIFYQSDPMARVRQLTANLPPTLQTAQQLSNLPQLPGDPVRRLYVVSRLLFASRADLPALTAPMRLRLLDASLELETLIFRTAATWQPTTPNGRWLKAQYLLQAAAGAGYIELWEWEALQPVLNTDTRKLSVADYGNMVETVKRALEWSIGTISAAYENSIAQFAAFEPLAGGFIDERLRASLLLSLGEVSSELGRHFAETSGQKNEVMGIANAADMRGINPGIAVGQLIVTDGIADASAFRSDAIYIMARTPAELKPVAGIATVSEGNMVSHIQLLARNLGIPNAVITPELMRELAAFSGEEVFYAVSPRGAVRIKPVQAMTAEERSLIEAQQRAETRIRVPTHRLDLSNTQLTSLFDLRAKDSGVVCGPKAANLGQLSSIFPGHVAPGFIVPFGVFRSHMNQRMPGADQTYWQFLQRAFATGEQMRAAGEMDENIDAFMLQRLAALREAIAVMPLQPAFLADLRRRFTQHFNAPLGNAPVFVRSDTNMEDLKDFTGAGLNLTVPNVRSEEAILQAIRNVWASPYRERGYRWRQKYLLNPEDVYPSLLILRSVNVEKSGVVITTGIASGQPEDLTFAFNRGVGGAVDGQAAETYEVTARGVRLLAPAREPVFTTLPPGGGTQKTYTSFENRILSPTDLEMLRAIAVQISQRLPGTPGIETDGPFDVELGMLDDHIYLFQARPFVQNKAANALSYLSDMEHTADLQSLVNFN